MKKETDRNYFIDSRAAQTECLVDIAELPTDGKYVVWIREAKHRRTLAQNRLYWGVWLRYLSGRSGMTTDELHDYFKRQFMIKIYLADPQTLTQIRWVELYNMVRGFGDREKTKVAADTVSTKIATMDQFSQYLDAIDRFATGQGESLPHTDDYKDAMEGFI